MADAQIRIKSMILGMVRTNCYIVYRENENPHCIVIDPGDRGDYIYESLSENKFSIDLILLTHAHFDHIGGANTLRKLSGAPIYCYSAEKALCEDAAVNCSSEYGEPVTVVPDAYLDDLQMIESAGMKCQLFATPGHTVGSCCYYFEEGHILFSGDTLFEDSVGRTDMPTGSMSALVHSVNEKLMVLPDDTNVYPGHGGMTTIGHERACSVFL